MKKSSRFICAVLACVTMFSSISFAVNIPVKGNPEDYIDIENHWANHSINYVIKEGYFKGITSNEFRPEANMSRAMIVTVLWRLTGEELTYTKYYDGEKKVFPTFVNMFWDMKDDAWYTYYVSWANEYDIIDGYSKREFRPDEFVTREQLSVILYNYLKNYKRVRHFSTLTVNEPVVFSDNDMIADWAKDKVSTIQQIGLMEGRKDGRFDPKATVTRAEVAVIIERLMAIL